MRIRPFTPLAGIVLAGLIAACGGTPSALSSTTSGRSELAPAQRPGLAGRDAAAPGPAAAAAASTGSTAPAARDSQPTIELGSPGINVERTVHAGFTVSNGTFMTAFHEVTHRAVAFGGSVASSSTSPDALGRIVTGSLVLRIPQAGLADFVAGVPADFHPSFIDFTTVDHTSEQVDARARLQEAQAHLVALNALRATMTNLTELDQLEQQILDTQHAVDVQTFSLDAIKDRVSMSTATIDITERGSRAAVPAPPSQISSAAHSGIDNDLAALAVAVEVALTGLPYALVLGLLLGTRRFWLTALRRIARPPSAAPEPAAPLDGASAGMTPYPPSTT